MSTLNGYGYIDVAKNTQRLTNNELICFGDTLWEKDVVDICSCLHKLDVKEFTILSQSKIFDILKIFEFYGFKMDGLVEVNSIVADIRTMKPKKIVAMKMRRK